MIPSRVVSDPARTAARAPEPARRPFADALGRMLRGRAEGAPSATRPLLDEACLATEAPMELARRGPPPAAAVAADPQQVGAGTERVASATDVLALRDRASVELRFEHGLHVRVDAGAAGVAISVQPGAAGAVPAIDPAALASAVRARGVPVARAELRGAPPRDRRGRSGAR